MRKKTIVKKPETSPHSVRCTDKEWQDITDLANQCGLTPSRYLLVSGLNHHPRQRLTQKDIDALNSLSTARTDLIKVSNALKGKSDEEKAKYFKSEKFMKWWVDAVAKLIRHWYSIEENITESVLTKVQDKV